MFVTSRKSIAIWAMAIVLCLTHLWRMDDIPWINDEPQLIIKALIANANHTLADSGLLGSFGVAYSPIIVWFYQLLLCFTCSILAIATVKAILTLALLFTAAAHFQRSTKLSPLGILLIAISPYLWFYNRQVWDNVFLIPLSLWLLAMMASFFKSPKAWKVYVSGGICLLMLHVHLMAIIPITAAVATTVIARRPHLRDEWKWYAGTVIGSILLFLPYLLTLRFQTVQRSQMHASGFITSLTASLTGVRFFSHWKFDRLIQGAYDAPAMAVAMSFTAIMGCALAIAGVGFALNRWRTIRKENQSASHLDWLTLYSALTVLGMTTFFIGTRAAPLPHYFNASWSAYLFLCWYGVSQLSERFKSATVIYGVYATVMVSLTIVLMNQIHASGGNKSVTYGPTLKNQLDIAATIAPHWPQVELDATYSCYRYFPHALQCLVALEMKRRNLHPADGQRQRFIVRFITPPDKLDGNMEVIGIPLPPENTVPGAP